jgi:hypothetical protein
MSFQMILTKLLASYYRKTARALKRHSPAQAARRLATAYRLRPGEDDARRAVDALIATELLQEARDICVRQVESGDRLEYWRHYASYIDDLEELSEKRRSSGGTTRIALFNDTDGRINIGCRLTSQNLKSKIATAFPDASIHSMGFRFSAYRMTEKSSFQGDVEDVRNELERLVEAGYGPRSVDNLLSAELVILQPEGSVDEDVSLQGLLTFFSPVLLAALLGKRTAIVNGTIPGYGDARKDFLKSAFALVEMVAARDEISADNYSIRFLPDAALLYAPPPFAGERDSCLITTGARNSADRDRLICAKALDICREFQLRPVILTRASSRFREFTTQITELNGVFAETASLPEAARTVSRCRLHVGARYHMAILCLVCGVPSVLFNVRTRKNEWLTRLSPLIILANFDDALLPLARELLPRAGEYPKPRDALGKDYVDLLRKARTAEKVDRNKTVVKLLKGLTHEANW